MSWINAATFSLAVPSSFINDRLNLNVAPINVVTVEFWRDGPQFVVDTVPRFLPPIRYPDDPSIGMAGYVLSLGGREPLAGYYLLNLYFKSYETLVFNVKTDIEVARSEDRFPDYDEYTIFMRLIEKPVVLWVFDNNLNASNQFNLVCSNTTYTIAQLKNAGATLSYASDNLTIFNPPTCQSAKLKIYDFEYNPIQQEPSKIVFRV